MGEEIGIWDWIVSIILIILIINISIRYRDSRYPVGHPWRSYFVPAISLKIGGAILIGIIYRYYYGFGDTFHYFYHAQTINSALGESFSTWLKLLLHLPDWYEADTYKYISNMPFYDNAANYSICSIAAFLGVFCCTLYLPIAILFAVVSFTGVWALFRTFATLSPQKVRLVAWATLYFPTVILWGSGLLKDSICLFSIGWLTHLIYNIQLKKKVLKNILLTIPCLCLIALIKIYIIISFLPACAFWQVTLMANKRGTSASRTVYYIALIPVMIGVVFLLSKVIATFNSSYSFEKITTVSQQLRNNIYATSLASEGSAYDLGKIETTPLGLLKKAPQAINVTLFRPYLWEARNPMMFVSALESLAVLLLTLFVLQRNGLRGLLRKMRRNPHIQFCVLFTLIFAFATGISTYNFGSLSRYKIPCMPFWGMALVLLWPYEPPVSAASSKGIPVRKRQLQDV